MTRKYSDFEEFNNYLLRQIAEGFFVGPSKEDMALARSILVSRSMPDDLWVIEVDHLQTLDEKGSHNCRVSAITGAMCTCDRKTWTPVRESFANLYKHGDGVKWIADQKRRMSPRGLEDCVMLIKRQWERIQAVMEFASYRIHNPTTGETIPLESLGL